MLQEQYSIDTIKERLHAAVDGIQSGDTSLLLTGSLAHTEDSITVIGHGDDEMDICALLTSVLCKLIDNLDEEDRSFVKNVVYVSLTTGKDGITAMLREAMQEGTTDGTE